MPTGEAMWSPRLFEYTAAASPAGASCTWSALGAMPMFLAKLPTGLLSGALLEKVVCAHRQRGTHVSARASVRFTAVWLCMTRALRRVPAACSSARRRGGGGRA